jgi:hypothetical protein
MFVSFTLLVVDTIWNYEISGLDKSLKFLALFLKEGGFQNLGISAGLAVEYLLDYESPDVDVPLKPFQTWQVIYEKPS